jgi:hypothetical protein
MAMVVALNLMLPPTAFAADLATKPASPSDIAGTYTLLLYGCHYPADIKDLAILVDSNSRYPVEIFDLPTSYKTKKDVAGPQALKEAEAFVRCSFKHVIGTQLRRILDDKGGTVGFEVRPLFFPLEFGQQDVLRVNYEMKGDVVRAYIRLDQDVKRAIESSGSNDRGSGGH